MATSNPRIIPLEEGWEKEIKEKVRGCWLAGWLRFIAPLCRVVFLCSTALEFVCFNG